MDQESQLRQTLLNRVRNGKEYPNLVAYLRNSEIPALERRMINLDGLDKNFSLAYNKLQGELEAYEKLASLQETD